jgi:hypothetical protein
MMEPTPEKGFPATEFRTIKAVVADATKTSNKGTRYGIFARKSPPEGLRHRRVISPTRVANTMEYSIIPGSDILDHSIRLSGV